MTPAELVLGKLSASLLELLVTITAGLPVFFLVMLLGGISVAQILRVYLATLILSFAAASLGVCIAYWRDKTFQTLALVVILLCSWIGLWETVTTSLSRSDIQLSEWSSFSLACHPIRAVMQLARPLAEGRSDVQSFSGLFGCFVFVYSLLILALCGIAMVRVRVWSQSEAERRGRGTLEKPGVPRAELAGGETAIDVVAEDKEEAARQRHIDSRQRPRAVVPPRTAWNNPILWRECATWAYGRKVIFIRLTYVALAALLAGAVHRTTHPDALRQSLEADAILPAVAQPLVALCLISLAILNALSVTSVTTERDGKSLDLLLATDLRPSEFLFGKLGGIASVAGLMILAPIVVVIYAAIRGGVTWAQCTYVVLSLLTLDLFVMVLGTHCGMRYANSRNAIGVSMGTFFFLSLGVAVCILIMISFSGSFQKQLVPFMTIILGGGVGLFAALGAGNPSSAIVMASITVPFTTFYAITCVLLTQEFPAFAATVGSYGFATAAMMVPALFEFDFAMGRTHSADD